VALLPALQLERDSGSRYPALVAYSRRAEALPEFVSTPLE
jgi:hypothetical protein